MTIGVAAHQYAQITFAGGGSVLEKWWRGRRIDGPEYYRDIYPESAESFPADKESRRWRRHSLRTAKFLMILVIGAALVVLVVYPLLPEYAQIQIHNAQDKVARLVPWSKGP
jgi:hypothetical protein